MPRGFERVVIRYSFFFLFSFCPKDSCERGNGLPSIQWRHLVVFSGASARSPSPPKLHEFSFLLTALSPSFMLLSRSPFSAPVFFFTWRPYQCTLADGSPRCNAIPVLQDGKTGWRRPLFGRDARNGSYLCPVILPRRLIESRCIIIPSHYHWKTGSSSLYL